MLEEGIRDHCHERMAVKTLPRPALEVIETEFLFELLVSLLANPSRLGSRQAAQVGRPWQVGEIVLFLSRHPVFADEPGLFPWWMLVTLAPDPVGRSVGDPHTHGCEPRLELSFRASAPADVLPFGGDQHVLGCDRRNVRNVLAPGTAAPGNRPDHLHICRVHLEVPWVTGGPGEFASRKPLTKRRAHPIAGSGAVASSRSYSTLAPRRAAPCAPHARRALARRPRATSRFPSSPPSSWRTTGSKRRSSRKAVRDFGPARPWRCRRWMRFSQIPIIVIMPGQSKWF